MSSYDDRRWDRILREEQRVSRDFWLGRTYYAKENFIRAKIEFDVVLLREPKDRNAHYWRARCHMNSGKYDYITVVPGRIEARYMLGWCDLRTEELATHN